jgi:hypothetical protein
MLAVGQGRELDADTANEFAATLISTRGQERLCHRGKPMRHLGELVVK